MKNSKYDEFKLNNGEKIISIEKPVLFETKIKNNIFRLKNNEFAIFISQVLKERIEKEKLTGFDFFKLKKKND